MHKIFFSLSYQLNYEHQFLSIPESMIFFLSFWTRVDFFIPGLATVGGFSICSSPRELKEFNTIELAVKDSQHPPALWVHTKVCVYNMPVPCIL